MVNVLIVGAGRISSQYDEPQDAAVLTHAHAIKRDKRFNLLGFYDPDSVKAQQAAEKWDAKSFSSLKSVDHADVVVVTSPDTFHLESVREVLQLRPRLIFLEKPIAATCADAKEIIALTKDCPVLVNFSRRFCLEFQALARQIESQLFGAFQMGSGYYGKGFVHNGSHMLDLLKLLIGNLKNVVQVGEIHDFYPSDPTRTMQMQFCSGGTFFMQGLSCAEYTHFELDLFFQKARIRIVNSGRQIEIYRPKASDTYKEYKYLELVEVIDAKIDHAMVNAYSNIYDVLAEGKPLLASLDSVFDANLYYG
jgi:predicted dehydrogenase